MAKQSRSRADTRLRQAAVLLRSRARRREAGPAAHLLKALYRDASAADLRAATAEDMGAAALSLWRFADGRPRGRPLVRVYFPDRKEHGWESDNAVVEIVTDDMPFLIDSVTALLSEHKHPIRPALGLDWLRAAATAVAAESHWQSMAIGAIVDDLLSQQRALAGRVLAAAPRARGDAAVNAWSNANDITVARTRDMVAEFRAGGTVDIARLALANRQVRAMLAAR
jgi:NAD-specific glutamate dehydrogenase